VSQASFAPNWCEVNPILSAITVKGRAGYVKIFYQLFSGDNYFILVKITNSMFCTNSPECCKWEIIVK
jgi:hypothetical protein